MPSVLDLGRMVKAKHPEYADIPDEQLGLKVQAKFPGSYDDFSPAPVTAPVPAGLQGAPPSMGAQMLQNLPGSALNAVEQSAGPVTMLLNAAQDIRHPRGVPDLGTVLSGVARPFVHPIDSLTEDPIGTAAAWYGGAKMLGRGPAQTVRGAIKAIPGEAGDTLRHIDLVHPFRSIPDVYKALKNIYAGGQEGLSDYRAAQRVGQERTPIWAGQTAPADLAPAPIGPIPEPTLSRVPNSGTAQQRLPIWLKQPGAAADQFPGPIGPIPKPVLHSAAQPSTNPLQNTGPIQPVPSAPPAPPLTGLHLPEVPAHYAGEPNPTAAFKVDQNVLAELRKAGAKADELTLDQVQAARKAAGHRPLSAKDAERRMSHLRLLLP